MRLHVLAGNCTLLRPELLNADQSAELIGPGVQVATAFWLSPRCGRFYHNFLYEVPEDRRIAVFARSIGENFGTRVDPLIVLPELLDGGPAPSDGNEAAAAPRRSPLEVVAEIWKQGGLERLHLHAVALPAAADPDGVWTAGTSLVAETEARLADLRVACANRGVPAEQVECTVISATPDLPSFTVLYRNALADRISARLVDRLAGAGLIFDPDTGTAAIAATLAAWSRNGLVPAPALDGQGFDSLTDRICTSLLAGSRDNG